jgi:hypothetical protein
MHCGLSALSVVCEARGPVILFVKRLLCSCSTAPSNEGERRNIKKVGGYIK